jgi:hypothetical protein
MEIVHKIAIYTCIVFVIMLTCVCNVNYYRTELCEEKIEQQNKTIDSLRIVISQRQMADTVVVKYINVNK